MSIKHIPLHPPRTSVPMECIYLSLWQGFASQRPDEWRAIFQDCPTRPRQRAASVAASFMVFMGCNGGRSFTHEADKLAATGTFLTKELAYLAAWAIENGRLNYINNGLRTIEYMLAREYPIHSIGTRLGNVNWKDVPVITMDDLDVIECMVRWWASSTASVIRNSASALLAAHEETERMKQHFSNSAP